MIVHKLKMGELGGTEFFASEAEARAAYATAVKPVTVPVQDFPDCCEVVYVDPGKAGIIRALNKHCGSK